MTQPNETANQIYKAIAENIAAILPNEDSEQYTPEQLEVLVTNPEFMDNMVATVAESITDYQNIKDEIRAYSEDDILDNVITDAKDND